ncbi:NAD(P)/FAD-dependent oxidoreductase [Brevibacillus agri]|uniref:NAD(P)/FAD-dependent oxidoreductase n=1 Tax=Brevibacillus agri TaxID=51101 RepID=UPI002E223AC8|nr:NAD(P)/FAD-dependent oxidoreductase [Brevibacillus agri]
MYDTIIVGGGIAGLQTAIQLARSPRRVAVIDVPGGRSAVAKNYRNILGFSEGVSGDFFRREGRKQAAQYGAEFIADEVTGLVANPEGSFRVTTKTRAGAQALQAKTLVMATGMADPFPAIAELRDCLGLSVFICPDCDGYESVGQTTAVIGDGSHAVQMAGELFFYTKKLVVVNHGGSEIDEEEQALLDRLGIGYRAARVEKLVQADGLLQRLELSSGEKLTVTRAFLAFPGAQAQTGLLQAFSVHINEKGHVRTDPRTKETDHRNLWAVGDIAVHSQQVAIAKGDGAQAAIWIQKRLRELDGELPFEQK